MVQGTVKGLRLRPLTIQEILSWADALHLATGRWPMKESGAVVECPFETWLGIDAALRTGGRGLPGRSSLAQLLAEKRGVRNIRALLPLTEERILAWIDDFHARTGSWPTNSSGPIEGSGKESWSSIDAALRAGVRGLPGRSSLPRLMTERRGVRNRKRPAPLSESQILAWADLHLAREGKWPTAKSGAIADAMGETWLAADMALRHGQRGLPGGSSLALFLAEHRGVRNTWTRPSLTIEKVLAWADRFQARTGRWPMLTSGSIEDAPGETWLAIDKALRGGKRGLPACGSLAKLIAVERGVRNRASVPRLTRKGILKWADSCYRRTGKWPVGSSGVIEEAPDETWAAVDAALHEGCRGLRGGSSLARLLAEQGRKKHRLDQPPLSQKKILTWADLHLERSGRWPNVNSGAVVNMPDEQWRAIDDALRQGNRGLPGGSSLSRLLAKKRGARNPLNLPPLSEEQIASWADLHRQRTGSWPKYKGGPIADAPGETWAGVDSALRNGKRTLPGGSSLAKLLGSKVSAQERSSRADADTNGETSAGTSCHAEQWAVERR